MLMRSAISHVARHARRVASMKHVPANLASIPNQPWRNLSMWRPALPRSPSFTLPRRGPLVLTRSASGGGGAGGTGGGYSGGGGTGGEDGSMGGAAGLWALYLSLLETKPVQQCTPHVQQPSHPLHLTAHHQGHHGWAAQHARGRARAGLHRAQQCTRLAPDHGAHHRGMYACCAAQRAALHLLALAVLLYGLSLCSHATMDAIAPYRRNVSDKCTHFLYTMHCRCI